MARSSPTRRISTPCRSSDEVGSEARAAPATISGVPLAPPIASTATVIMGAADALSSAPYLTRGWRGFGPFCAIPLRMKMQLPDDAVEKAVHAVNSAFYKAFEALD